MLDSKKGTKRSFPREVETAVLFQSKRRCALCFGFTGDLAKKHGQLAHIDRNPANADKDNAVFLCMPHHDEYDSVPRQTKRITPEELKLYRQALYEALAVPGALGQARRPKLNRTGTKGVASVSTDIYDRRIPIYRATLQFLRAVNTDLRPDLQAIIKFGAETDEALFLFDEIIADHLSELVKRAFRLRAVAQTLSMGFTEAMAKEETELAMWFYEQFAETRRKFAPFLRLA